MPKSSRIWLYLAAGLYLLSILSAMLANNQNHVASQDKHPQITTATGLQNQIVGFSLNVHYTQQLPKYFQAIDMVAQMGCNSLQILTPAFQKHGASNHITMPNQPGGVPTSNQLSQLIKHAKKRNLKTLLMPTILFSQPRGNEWRGKISPDNWDRWWESYTQTMLHFAKLATQNKVDIFCVGSELLTTEKQTRRWTQLISQIRKIYQGKLTYSTNWDHYHVPTFWDQLDAIGISGYWSIDEVKKPTPKLNASWQKIQRALQRFSKQAGKPILITELGYPCLPWALKDPWNYVADHDSVAAPDVQAQGYQIFCDNWTELIHPKTPIKTNDFAGVIFYTWDPYHGGLKDTGYGVWGKPAQSILKQWLNRPSIQH